ncbi:hypothetical protein [Streptomyces mangrovisoli]|uniref:hypothetical protein n=1 Tax=Streptomyces mangrovisoli TaxID=1428628 RepID=UPI0011602B3F|nr:hypothetical protein [Streptomyces mangrovisoli]
MVDHQAGSSATESREDIGYVCGQLDHIRSVLQAHGADGAAPLEHLLAVLDDGGDLTAPLSELHDALLVAGDAAGIRGQARGLHPIGIAPTTPDEWVLLCPTGRCSRHAWPDGSGPSHCQVSNLPLRREQL